MKKLFRRKFKNIAMIIFTTLIIIFSSSFIFPFHLHTAGTYAQSPGILQNILLGDISIAEIRKLLLDSLERLSSVIKDAGGEFREVGDSLENNANKVIKEIDKTFGNRLDKTIRQLNETEKKVFEDIGRVIQENENATEAIIKGAGKEARRAIFEGDIAAYNSLYSLPCRNKIPRIVYIEPDEVIVNNDDPFVKIRGNFLDIGSESKVKVDGIETNIIARNNNEIAIAIPEKILNNLDDSKLLSISLTLYKTTVIPVVCWARDSIINSPLQTSVKLTPQVKYNIEGYIEGNYEKITPEEVKEDIQNFPQRRTKVIDENCGVNETIRRDFLIEKGWEIIDKTFTEISANCGTSLEGIDFQGNRAVVRTRLKGCGYTTVRGPFGAILYKDCNGRGWHEYDLTLIGRRRTIIPEKRERISLPKETFNISGTSGQTTFTDIRHTSANTNLRDDNWYYTATIKGTRGRKQISPVQVNTNLPTAVNVTSKMENGILSIRILK
ncbi:hypothetical protein [Crocosphaera chwakensis]|uniref:Uncharacterized protein n=1 Tax=Crocosphaera chwakensis CCY0110 TaxID=391612 RepID=A3INU2_9CHRO|nr:hypothetical protein [Crocosphaera chwakensis]EAZ91990.1 hypothetical protein CY0110_29984 [Crocosphaera chwakensis CCY0110]